MLQAINQFFMFFTTMFSAATYAAKGVESTCKGLAIGGEIIETMATDHRDILRTESAERLTIAAQRAKLTTLKLQKSLDEESRTLNLSTPVVRASKSQS